MYGSSLMLVTRIPRDSRIAARDAAAMPLPREETTPPVTKTYLVIYLARVSPLEEPRPRNVRPVYRRGLLRGPGRHGSPWTASLQHAPRSRLTATGKGVS